MVFRCIKAIDAVLFTEVIRENAERVSKEISSSHKGNSRFERCIKPFVGVGSQGVCTLDPLKQVPDKLRPGSRPSVSRINMKPHRIAGGELRQFIQGID